jgi:hypothetical protein
MQDALHQGGHKYLKLLFVLALAGSSALFFIGPAIPKPPALVVVIVGAVLGLALEWSYFTFSCDLSEAISEGNKVGIFVNGVYTLAGGAASWFLFTNAALHVGWAPTDDLLGLSRQHWAMIMAGLIVLVIFVLSARRKRITNAVDLQAWGRGITLMLPNADDATRLSMLSTIAKVASESQGAKALPEARVVEATVRRPGLLQRGWQALWSGEEVPAGASAAPHVQPEQDEQEGKQDGTLRHRDAAASISPEAPSKAGPAVPNYLELAIEALTVNPNISDAELSSTLGLKHPASARYWKLKAQQFLLGHQHPAPLRQEEQRPPRSRQEALNDLRGFAQALKADTGLDLESLVREHLLANAAKGPKDPSEQVTVPLPAPVEEAESQPVEEYPPFPATREAKSATNHGNHGDMNGAFERWNGGGEGQSQNGDSPFRR